MGIEERTSTWRERRGEERKLEVRSQRREQQGPCERGEKRLEGERGR